MLLYTVFVDDLKNKQTYKRIKFQQWIREERLTETVKKNSKQTKFSEYFFARNYKCLTKIIWEMCMKKNFDCQWNF